MTGRSHIAGRFAHPGSALRNRPWGPYWIDVALILMRYVRDNIERAKADGAATERCALAASRLIAELERDLEAALVPPRPHREDELQVHETACASTPSALGLDL